MGPVKPLPPAQHSQRLAGALCLAALAILAGMLATPAVRVLAPASTEWLTLHLLLEIAAVVVSVLIVTIAWQSLPASDARVSNALIYGFSVVAGCDLMHGISGGGMPAFFSEGSSAKALFFWLAGRSVELLTVGLVACQARLPMSRGFWQIGALATIAGLFYLGTWHLAWFPATQLPAGSQPTFKVRFEILLCAGWQLAALHFVRLGRRGHAARNAWLAAACFIMGVGELVLATSVDTPDLAVIFGHLLQTLSYVLIYRATCLMSVHEPYERLKQSESALQSKRSELDALLSQVPVGLIRVDAEGRIRYINERQAQRHGTTADALIGHAFESLLSPDLQTNFRANRMLALAGQQVSGEDQSVDAQGRMLCSAITLAPERSADGRIIGTISVLLDKTAEHHTQARLLESLREVTELKAALDAHAIVAITDARGVISQVNDKFCQISQYSRQELIGQTHRLINSGFHPPSFFHDLWRRIVHGEVWNGEICNRAKDGSLYWVYTTIVPFLGDNGQPRQYIAIRADISERKRIELQIREIAFQDELTALPNRRLLMDRLGQSLLASERSGQHGALLFLDLDHFKEVNDSLGHDTGDKLLRMAAERLRHGVRQSDTVARFGGDEFVVLLSNLGTDPLDATAAAGSLAKAIHAALYKPYLLGGTPVICTPSIGVVLYRGQAQRPEELLKRADIALYQAKGNGRNTLCFFDPQTQADFQERLAIESDLRQALEQGQYEIHHQPIVDVQRRIIGLEALLRWRHPVRGLVSPAAFIPLAEKSGLIVLIGRWVLEQACRQLAAWRDDPVKSAWSLAVNVSARQFHDDSFVSTVLEALGRDGVRPGRLKIEITESTLLTELQEAIEKMQILRSHGVRFAIDDFGTGYSSLGYLRKLPIDVLKIDRSFVREVDTNEDDQAIARTVLELARSLKLEVVAEGVETEGQFAFLHSAGCQYFQGYLLGRPAPAAATPAPT